MYRRYQTRSQSQSQRTESQLPAESTATAAPESTAATPETAATAADSTAVPETAAAPRRREGGAPVANTQLQQEVQAQNQKRYRVGLGL